MAPTGSGPLYAKDEKVLCFHLELLYEAKVLDSKQKDPNDKKEGFLYKVHYKGWKNTWDDWVPQERIRKFTDENKELAANLRRDMEVHRAAAVKSAAPASAKRRGFGSAATGGSGRGSEDRSSAAPSGPRGTKRSREIEGIDKEDEFYRRAAIKMFMPNDLKSILVDDWEKVTKERMLVPLPHPVSISQFLNEYENSEVLHRQAGSADADLLEEFLAGIREYFNKALGRILLYKFERRQYFDIYRELDKGFGDLAGKTLCDVYGCEHLLRLFVKLPELIAHTNMDQAATQRLREELTKLTSWLNHRVNRYLTTEYEAAGPEYIERSKTG